MLVVVFVRKVFYLAIIKRKKRLYLGMHMISRLFALSFSYGSCKSLCSESYYMLLQSLSIYIMSTLTDC